MTTAFLHGVETVETTTATRQISAVKTAVVGLVGVAPLSRVDPANQKINTPVLITSRADALKSFGPELAGYTIPQALRAIFNYDVGLVIVINTFDPDVHKTAVASADHVLDANGEVVLGHTDISDVVVKNQAGDTTYLLDTDYTVDAVTGTVARKEGGAIAAGATVGIAFSFADPTLVDSAAIIGATDAGGVRTGAQALLDAQAALGMEPKLLIAPAYSTQATVVAALDALAASLEAMALIDAPAGTSFADVLAGRAANGAINLSTTSDRVVPCYPYLNVPDADGTEVLEPFSQHLAGAIAARDNELGYHWSPSNAELLGVKGLERNLTWSLNDPNSEVNQLNDAGIMTAVNIAGVVRTWGNRSAAWPSDTDPINFINVRRVADVVHESVRLAMVPFVDQPITEALIDSIKASVNRFLRTLVARGAIIDGACTYDSGDNPSDELAAGHLTFGLTFMPSTPAERITFKSYIDTTLLAELTAQTA